MYGCKEVKSTVLSALGCALSNKTSSLTHFSADGSLEDSPLVIDSVNHLFHVESKQMSTPLDQIRHALSLLSSLTMLFTFFSCQLSSILCIILGKEHHDLYHCAHLSLVGRHG